MTEICRSRFSLLGSRFVFPPPPRLRRDLAEALRAKAGNVGVRVRGGPVTTFPRAPGFTSSTFVTAVWASQELRTATRFRRKPACFVAARDVLSQHVCRRPSGASTTFERGKRAASTKQAVYAVCDEGPLSRDWDRQRQLEDSVAGPPGHLAEGFGRFNPAEFARYTVIARSSLMESQNHLRDAVDRKHISEAKRQELDALAETALKEVTGLMEYLQSPEALRNARRARERRIASRHERKSARVA